MFDRIQNEKKIVYKKPFTKIVNGFLILLTNFSRNVKYFNITIIYVKSCHNRRFYQIYMFE